MPAVHTGGLGSLGGGERYLRCLIHRNHRIVYHAAGSYATKNRDDIASKVRGVTPQAQVP